MGYLEIFAYSVLIGFVGIILILFSTFLIWAVVQAIYSIIELFNDLRG